MKIVLFVGRIGLIHAMKLTKGYDLQIHEPFPFVDWKRLLCCRSGPLADAGEQQHRQCFFVEADCRQKD